MFDIWYLIFYGTKKTRYKLIEMVDRKRVKGRKGNLIASTRFEGWLPD